MRVWRDSRHTKRARQVRAFTHTLFMKRKEGKSINWVLTWRIILARPLHGCSFLLWNKTIHFLLRGFLFHLPWAEFQKGEKVTVSAYPRNVSCIKLLALMSSSPESNTKNITENHTNIVVHYCYCKRWTIRTPGGCGYFAPIDDLLTVRSDSNICVVFCHHEEQGKGPKWPERKLSHTMHWLNVSIKAKIVALDVSSRKY